VIGRASPLGALLRGALVAVVLALAWRVVVLGLAEHYAGDSPGGSEEAARALLWCPGHPQALYQAGLAAYAQDPAEAVRLWRRAVVADPANGSILVRLGRAWSAPGQSGPAGQAMALADRLSPLDADVLLQSGAYWLERGELREALTHLGRAVARRPTLGSEIYPLLLRVASDNQSYPALEVLTRDPPPWWDDFMRYAARRARSLKPLYTLAALRGVSPHPLSAVERNAYVERLQREGLWGQAYMVWSENLPRALRRGLGLLYNGGFELDITNRGFDWHTPPVKGVSVGVGRTFGARGERALRVTFSGHQGRFHHVYQPLYLQPGRYRLRGLAKLRDLRTPKGLQWQVSCVAAKQPLAASELFYGTDEWRAFGFGFEVPHSGCEGQTLRLVSLGEIPADFAFKGEIWFDDLIIQRGG